MINRRIITSLLVLGVVGALAGGSTFALLNDTETSDTNTFQAGPMQLNMDMESRLNGEALAEEEIGEGQPFARLDDVKPGDVAEEEVSVGVEGNPAFVEMRLNQTMENTENSCTEPEAEAEGGGCGEEGELRENTHLTVWQDSNENGEIDGDEEVMLENPHENAEQLEEGMMIDADPSTEEIEPFQDGSQTVVYRWEVPRSLGNEAQTDSFAYDLQMRAEQARHNGPDNAAEWYQVTGEDAGEPVDNESEDSNSDEDESNESDSDNTESDNSDGFSDEEQSNTNEFNAESDETEDDSNESDTNSNSNEEPQQEQESESDHTTEETGKENNNPSTGQFSAGAAGATGLLLILFVSASALYRKRL